MWRDLHRDRKAHGPVAKQGNLIVRNVIPVVRVELVYVESSQ